MKGGVSLFDLAELDPQEYELVVEWVRDLQEAEKAAASGDREPSIDMDADDWQERIRS
jgi:hypothetical protein